MKSNSTPPAQKEAIPSEKSLATKLQDKTKSVKSATPKRRVNPRLLIL
ncbi:hypothetical protein [Pedobacter sp. BAL39]|nr:hypothetical protein [Pedobacter sp. BAL39]